MAEGHLTVKDGLVVGLEYDLRLGDGQLVVASKDEKPVKYLQGYRQMVPGLEQALYGMTVGDAKQVVVKPENGFGLVDPEAFTVVPHDAFPPELELIPGTRVRMRDEVGNILSAEVVEDKTDGVLLDFNHPLAGETLHFDVKIVSLRKATSEELAQATRFEPNES